MLFGSSHHGDTENTDNGNVPTTKARREGQEFTTTNTKPTKEELKIRV